MNRKLDISLPVADDAVMVEHRRIALDSNGQAVYCGADDVCIGHLTMDVNAPYGGDYTTSGESIGRKVAPINRLPGGLQKAYASEAMTAGDEFIGAADGKIAKLPVVTVTAIAASSEAATAADHGLLVGDAVVFKTLTGGAGLSLDTVYYVNSVADKDTFTVSAVRGGASVDVTTNYTAATVTRVGAGEGQVITTCSADTLVRVIYFSK